MTEELSKVIGHDIGQLAKGWQLYLDEIAGDSTPGTIGAGTRKQHLVGLSAVARELLVVLSAAIKSEV